MFALSQIFREQVTFRITVEFSNERLGVRVMTDRDKDACDFQLAFFAGLHITQTHGAHFAFFVRNIFRNYGVPDRFDLFIREHAVGHNF